MTLWTRRALLGALALVPAGYALATRDPRRGGTHMVPAGGYGPSYFPNVMLTDHDGKKVRFYDDLLAGRFVVINFMYTVCEGVCSGITHNLRGAQEILGDRMGRTVFMYSITLKPEEDDPARLAKYAKEYKIGPGWRFLTGNKDDLEQVRNKLGFTDPDPRIDAIRSQHTGMVKFGDVEMQRWAACPGKLKPEAIAEAIVNLIPPHKRYG